MRRSEASLEGHVMKRQGDCTDRLLTAMFCLAVIGLVTVIGGGLTLVYLAVMAWC